MSTAETIPPDRRALRVAGFSGYPGDRAGALAEAFAGDPVDVLVADHLAG